jgi:hypothetical protein
MSTEVKRAQFLLKLQALVGEYEVEMCVSGTDVMFYEPSNLSTYLKVDTTEFFLSEITRAIEE